LGPPSPCTESLAQAPGEGSLLTSALAEPAPAPKTTTLTKPATLRSPTTLPPSSTLTKPATLPSPTTLSEPAARPATLARSSGLPALTPRCQELQKPSPTIAARVATLLFAAH
jgi:hypothetical protein